MRRQLPRWRKLMTYSSLLPLLQARSAFVYSAWLLPACKCNMSRCISPQIRIAAQGYAAAQYWPVWRRIPGTVSEKAT